MSVGRGTDRPFEWIGAPWIDGPKLAAALTKEDLPGVRFVPCRQTPTSSTFKGKECDGVQILVDDWSRFRPVRTGMALACALRKLYPDDWKVDGYDRLLVQRRDAGGAEARGDVATAGKGMADGVDPLPRAAASVFVVSGIDKGMRLLRSPLTPADGRANMETGGDAHVAGSMPYVLHAAGSPHRCDDCFRFGRVSIPETCFTIRSP